MAPVGLYRATPVKWHESMGPMLSGIQNPVGVTYPGPSNLMPVGAKGVLQKPEKPNKLTKYLSITIDKATEILGMDNWMLHAFCVTAYYPGECDDVIEARKTRTVPAGRSSVGSKYEDCYFFETIRLPYDPTQEAVVIDVYEVEIGLERSRFPDELIGRVAVPLAWPNLERMAEYPLARGMEFGGTVRASIKFPTEEVKIQPPPDISTFPDPVSPRAYRQSAAMPKFAKGGVKMEEPHQAGIWKPNGGANSKGFEEPRSRASSKSSQGSSQQCNVWLPFEGFGLDLPVMDELWKFASGPSKISGTMSPFPQFSLDWFIAKLPPDTPLPLGPRPPFHTVVRPPARVGAVQPVAPSLVPHRVATRAQPPAPRVVLPPVVSYQPIVWPQSCGGQLQPSFTPSIVQVVTAPPVYL